MKFTKMVAVVAIISLAAQAKADDGMLRRDVSVAQADVTTNTKEVIVINTQPQQAAVAQPVTNVEATPAVESKAELMRKEREKAEVQTEQKIVEKLEDSRLQEERARADRLFGNKLDPQPQQQQQQPAVQAVVPVPPPPAPAPQDKPAPQPTQVTIEKVEIVQPAPVPAAIEPKAEEDKPVVAEVKTDAEKAPAEPSKQKFFVEGMAGNLSYGASNVKSNYAIGVGAGMIFDDRWVLEGSYMYSDHDVSDVWQTQLFHDLVQSDISASAKYYLMSGKLKPYVGASLSWINRKYTDRYLNSYYYYNNTSSTSTNAVDAGLLGGVDFAVSDSVLIGAGFDYNFNVMTTTDIDLANYGLPPGVQELEKISYTTIKVTAKFIF